jgi:hypothetical protein
MFTEPETRRQQREQNKDRVKVDNTQIRHTVMRQAASDPQIGTDHDRWISPTAQLLIPRLARQAKENKWGEKKNEKQMKSRWDTDHVPVVGYPVFTTNTTHRRWNFGRAYVQKSLAPPTFH